MTKSTEKTAVKLTRKMKYETKQVTDFQVAAIQDYFKAKKLNFTHVSPSTRTAMAKILNDGSEAANKSAWKMTWSKNLRLTVERSIFLTNNHEASSGNLLIVRAYEMVDSLNRTGEVCEKGEIEAVVFENPYSTPR